MFLFSKKLLPNLLEALVVILVFPVFPSDEPGESGRISIGEEEFTEALCDFSAILIPCDHIQYQVFSMENFEDAENLDDAAFDEEGNLEDQQFDAGDENDVVLIRTSYKYPIKTPLMWPMLTNNNDTNRIMLSTIVLQTEPYAF